MKVLILGAGAVGLTLAAKLSSVCDVHAVCRQRHADRIKGSGFKMTGIWGEATCTFSCSEDVPEDNYDYIFITSKSTATESICEQFSDIIKGREKQEKKYGSRGFLARLLRGKPGDSSPKDREKELKAYEKKSDIIDRRGHDAVKDKMEKERRGGGLWTAGGRDGGGEKLTKELKKQRQKKGMPRVQDDDVYEDDLPPSDRIQRRRAKVDREVERKKARQEAERKK